MPNTPLLNAVVQNDTAAAEKLLAEGADPNEGRFAGIPPIFFVVMHQNTRLFHAMKAKGADIKVKDKTGTNLLMWAAADDSGRANWWKSSCAWAWIQATRIQKGTTR